MFVNTKKPLIHEMNIQERPREKFEHFGPDKLSDAELLALILRTGSRNKSAVCLSEEILDLDIPGIGLEKLYHLFYDNTEFYLPRKKEKFQLWLNIPRDSNSSNEE